MNKTESATLIFQTVLSLGVIETDSFAWWLSAAFPEGADGYFLRK